MKKKGQMELFGAIIVLTIIIVGGYFLTQEKEISITGNAVGQLPEYVANIKTNYVCETTGDNLKRIPLGDRVFFVSLDQANKIGFIYSESCE